MPPATEPYDVIQRAGEAVVLPVAASTVLFSGALGAINAAGNALPAADAAGLKVVGRIRDNVDNAAGAAGAAQAVLEPGVFRFGNSAAEPITAAHLRGPAYVEDDTTVASDPGTHGIIAGEIVAIEPAGVWIDTRKAALHAAIAALDARLTIVENL